MAVQLEQEVVAKELLLNMKTYLTYLLVFVSMISFSQETISDLLKKYNKHSVPYISVQELAMPKTEAIILDARELKEFNTSHIKNAINVGFDFFDINSIPNLISNKEITIVVYCSVGIRSETIAEKIINLGYKNVFNLYGGIFEWKNNDFPLYNSSSKLTDEVHTFSKEWSPWLTKGVKVYE